MDRIIPEKQAAVLLAVFGLAIGTNFGWNHLEAESKKQHLLAKNDYLELYGSCREFNSFLPNSNLTPSGYEIIQVSELGGYRYLTALHWEKVVREVKSKNKIPAFSFRPTIVKNNLPPGFSLFASSFKVVNSENTDDVIIPEQITGGILFCPSLILQEIKEDLLSIFPSPEPPKPDNYDEIFKNVKQV